MAKISHFIIQKNSQNTIHLTNSSKHDIVRCSKITKQTTGTPITTHTQERESLQRPHTRGNPARALFIKKSFCFDRRALGSMANQPKLVRTVRSTQSHVDCPWPYIVHYICDYAYCLNERERDSFWREAYTISYHFWAPYRVPKVIRLYII